MKPGRKLDALVAKKVFGFKVYETDDCNGDDNLWIDKHSGESLHHYSTDIAEAWEVVEKLAKTGFCCLKLSGDYNYQWTFALTAEGNDKKNPDHEPDFIARAETPSHAICLAALKAISGTELVTGKK